MVELLLRRGETVPPGPPDSATLEKVQAWERDVLSGHGVVQMSVGPRTQGVDRRALSTVSLRVTDDLIDFYRALETRV